MTVVEAARRGHALPIAVVQREPRTPEQQDAARLFWSKFTSSMEDTK
jgi:hypothetical protein